MQQPTWPELATAVVVLLAIYGAFVAAIALALYGAPVVALWVAEWVRAVVRYAA